MKSFIVEGQFVDELKMFLEADSLEEIRQRLKILYMVIILCTMNLDFDHIQDQILTNQEVPLVDQIFNQSRSPIRDQSRIFFI